MDIVVKYNLYNVGDNTATNVQVDNFEIGEREGERLKAS